jgi:glycosyltransferase involved in cell wall biosynthesis
MRVLYVSHTARVSGGERSLLDLVTALPRSVAAAIACPPGELAERARAAGVPTFAIAGTDGSLRLHPRHTTSALAQMSRAALSLRGLVRRLRPDVVHANSLRAGMVAGLAGRLGAPRPVVHVRDCMPATPLADAVRSFVSSSAGLIIANSQYTSGGYDVAGGAPVRVVHNAIDLERFDPQRHDRHACRARLALASDDVALGVVAQITPWKAQDDALRILAGLRSRWPGARLLLVGGVTFDAAATRYDNRAYERHLHALAADLGIADAVGFLGPREDIPEILRALDLLLVPSWEEPFGRTILEGMATGTPVVATSIGGPAEIISDGVDGRLLAPRIPELWVREIDGLLGDPQRTAAMTARARARVGRCHHRAAHVAAILDAYSDVSPSVRH